MSSLPLTFGPLNAPKVVRSGIRWLCPDGHNCVANEIVAFCDIALAGDRSAFAGELQDLQVSFAAPVAGRIRHIPARSPGGYVGRLPMFDWDADKPWAHLEGVEDSNAKGEPGLLFTAGRRFIGVAENRSGVLTGWHDRARAWWGEGAGATLLGAGICDMDAVFRGDGASFGEFFNHAAGPAQVVHSQDGPLVPCAAVFAEQLARTPDDIAAIREDVAHSFPSGAHVPMAAEWMFIGALLNALERSPLDEDYDILTRAGLQRAGHAEFVCLSLAAEMAFAARHRRLGYTLNFHNFRITESGPAVRDWLRQNFEFRPRSVDAVAADYSRLFAAAPDRVFFIINRISTQAHESIQSYQALDERVIASLSTLHAKELNLMLHDLARAPNVEIVDADSIVAQLGMYLHFRDGIHGTAAVYDEIRAELLHKLHGHNPASFERRVISQS